MIAIMVIAFDKQHIKFSFIDFVKYSLALAYDLSLNNLHLFV